MPTSVIGGVSRPALNLLNCSQPPRVVNFKHASYTHDNVVHKRRW